MARVVLIGDVGGHPDQLRAALTRAGAGTGGSPRTRRTGGSWLRHHAGGGFVPFGQVHGHSSIARYADRTWRCPGRVRQRATVDWHARHVRVRAGGRAFVGIDPKHGTAGAPAWTPLTLPGATLLSHPIPFETW